MKEVIVTGFSNATSEGIVLHTNVKARLVGGSMECNEFWVSWDKIGALLFEDYTDKVSVEDRNKLRSAE